MTTQNGAPKASSATQNPSLHDVLVLKNGKIFRFPVDDSGEFTKVPQPMTARDIGFRKVNAVAHEEAQAGPAFAVLPIKPDPATSAVCCYVINAENLTPNNSWTAAEWSDEPGPSDREVAGPAESPDFELLIAGPAGRIYRVAASGDNATVDMMDPDQLGQEIGLWTQLRNGVVAGAVRLQGGSSAGELIPLVNMTSLMRGGGQ